MENKLELVFDVNGVGYTDSLKVAERFKKRPANVLRKIENLECSKEFFELNFELNEYTDSIGRKLPMYKMTKDGFTFLAMGFTGKEAAQFKEEYIKAFNELEHKYKQVLLEKEYLYNQLFNADNLLSFNMAVKSLGKGIGRNKTMKDLRKRGVLLKKHNIPAQRFVDNGYFEVKDVIKTNKFKTRVIPTTFVTPKGLDYLAKLYA